MSEAAQGENEPIWDLIVRHLPEIEMIARFVAQKYRYMTMTRLDAEELAQLAILRIYEKSERDKLAFPTSERFLSWVKRVLMNVAHEYLRKASIHIPLDYVEETAIDKRSEYLQQYALHREEIATLPKPYRIVIELFLEGLATDEVADYLNISADTVRQRLKRAKSKLKAIAGGGKQ